jgi:archaellum biogenesis ATPase FlaH
MSKLDKQMPSDAPTSQGHIGKSDNKSLAFGKAEGNHFAQKSGKSSTSLQDLGELGNAAIEYAKVGFKVLPLIACSKKPVAGHGSLDATSDLKTIAALWRKNPNCNIGLLPDEMQNGKRLAVLDVDPRNGGNKTLAALTAEYGELSDTLTAISGRGDGGTHHYYYVPEDIARSGTDALGEGLDIKSSNGYVVAAPSIHPDTLKPYGWGGGADLVGIEAMVASIADMPEWMVSKLRSRNGAVRDRERLHRVGVRTADPQQIEDLKSALSHIPADSYGIWAHIGMALYELGDVGKDLWIEWSKTSDKHIPSDAEKWGDFAKTEELHFESVFHEAGSRGWVNPLANSSEFEEDVSLEMLEGCIVPIDLSDDVFREYPHIVDDILPCGEVTLFAGHGGSGKSYVSLVMAIHVAMGLPIGRFAVKQSKVVFYSAEDRGLILNQRVGKICRELRIDRKALEGKLLLLDVSERDSALHRPRKGVIDCSTPLMKHMSTLVTKIDPGMVIIDNSSETFDDEENARAPVRKFMRSLRNLASPSRAVLLLTHVNKASMGTSKFKGGTEDYSGSSAWHNSARSRLSLAKGEIEGELVLTHLKSNYGALTSPIGFIKVDGIPIPKSDLTKPLEERREVLGKVAREKDKEALYQVLLACEGDDIHAPAATTGQRTSFKHLSVREGFPSTCNKARTDTLLQELFREGLIHIAEESTGERNKPSSRWRCSIDVPDLV